MAYLKILCQEFKNDNNDNDDDDDDDGNQCPIQVIFNGYHCNHHIFFSLQTF